MLFINSAEECVLNLGADRIAKDRSDKRRRKALVVWKKDKNNHTMMQPLGAGAEDPETLSRGSARDKYALMGLIGG